MDFQDIYKGLRKSLRASVDTKTRATATVFSAGLAYVLLSMAAFPVYSSQLLGADLLYIDNILVALTENSYATSPLGLSLTMIYSGLIGVAATDIYIGLKMKGLEGVLGLGGAAPGFLAAGCAGCGAGLLSLLGFTGALTVLPFGGEGVTAIGLLIITASLAYIGDPETCEI